MVRFAPKAEKSLHRSEMTLRADVVEKGLVIFGE